MLRATIRTALVVCCTGVMVAFPDSGMHAAAESPAQSVVCPPGGGDCVLTVRTPGNPAARVSHVDGRCGFGGRAVDCYDPLLGWFDGTGCYWTRANPQPGPEDPIWAGHHGGAIYQVTCFTTGGVAVPGTGGGWAWRPVPPPGFGGGPATLAAQAVNRLGLRGPDIGIAPRPDGTGLVGLPVWLWTRVTPHTWGPVTATAAVPGMSVTATAHATRIDWTTGDGHTITCAGPGTPYRLVRTGALSPTCGYTYPRSSAGQPDQRYMVTGTTTWHVHWVGGGAAGDMTVTRRASTSVRIAELQVLLRAGDQEHQR